MRENQLHRISVIALFVLSLTASVVPWSIAWLGGQIGQPPAEDEGTAAHLFQLSIVSLVPVTLIFCATADWTRPWNIVKRVAVPAILVMLSIAGLFYYERVYVPAHF